MNISRLMSLATFTLILTLFTHQSIAGMMDEPRVGQVLFDKLETSDAPNTDIHWEMTAKVSQYLSSWQWQSEGHADGDAIESENLFVYSTAIKPYWDIQFGVGLDTTDHGNTEWAAVGLVGMAPYFVESKIHLLANGDAAILKMKFEKSFLLTQRLELLPEMEIVASSETLPENGIGKGLSKARLGVRLDYQISRKFAPYVGLNYTQHFGDNKILTGVDSESSLVAGVRIWF